MGVGKVLSLVDSHEQEYIEVAKCINKNQTVDNSQSMYKNNKNLGYVVL